MINVRLYPRRCVMKLFSVLNKKIIVLLCCTFSLLVHAAGDASHGQYLVAAAGCAGCHTNNTEDARPFAGGRTLNTPFGVFHVPNITPHKQTGIGSWTEADFVRALRDGVRPDGQHYYPAFPYTSYTGISDADLGDIWAYLQTLPAINQANQDHELQFPYSMRWLLGPWKWLYFNSGAGTEVSNRGAYLVDVLGHCGECHSQRNSLGAVIHERHLGGGSLAEDKYAPSLAPGDLQQWTDEELKQFLATGDKPDGDVANATMDEVIRNTTSQLTSADMDAVIAYLRSLPPVDSESDNQ